jgi:hypothetical protein
MRILRDEPICVSYSIDAFVNLLDVAGIEAL